MMRFKTLEELGCTAAISGMEDGDCARTADGADTRRFMERLGIAQPAPVLLRQTHSDRIFVAEELLPGNAPEGDALITIRPGLAIGVTVADCVPVLLYAPKEGVAGIAHAGREGTRQRIAAKTVAAMKDAFNISPEALHAVIGPSAGLCCYEVSTEMAQELASEGIPRVGRHLNLWEANFQQLVGQGVPVARIAVSGHCTVCGRVFHSYRHSGTTSRNVAVLAASASPN